MASLAGTYTEMLVTVAARAADCDGYLTLYKQSELVYIVEFKDLDGSHIVQADIDSVHIDVKNRTVRIQEPGIDEDVDVVLEILDRYHLQSFHDAQRECQQICNLTLEFVARLRDVYFAGVFRSIEPGNDLVVGSKIAELQDEAKRAFLHRCLASQPKSKPVTIATKRRRKVNHHHMAVSSSQKTAAWDSDEEQIGGEIVAEDGPVQCFYCSYVTTDPSDKHFVHPYVPRNFLRAPIFMCECCVENWKLYRDEALQEARLVLPGEVNEEVCALCSDTPEMLILCNNCTRSFCEPCLRKVMTTDAVERVLNSENDWQCMSCSCKLSRKPLLTREAWTRVEVRFKTMKKTAMSVPGSAPVADEGAVVVRGKLKFQKKAASAAAAAAAVSDGVDEKKDDAPETAMGISFLSYRTQPTSSDGTGDEVGAQGRRLHRQVRPSQKLLDAAAPFVRKASADKPTGPVAGPSPQNAMPKKSKPLPFKSFPGKPVKDGSSIMALTGQPQPMDEVYYFCTYLTALEATVPGNITEDVCFLCKDGGEVMECDLRHRGGRRCLKVHHEQCLGFKVQDGVKWLCPRHYCSHCGGRELQFICAYCPVSVCRDCPDAFANKFGLNKYCVLADERTSSLHNATTIACESCINLITAGKERGLLAKTFQAAAMARIETLSDQFVGKPEGSSVFVVLPASNGVNDKQNKVSKVKPKTKKTVAPIASTAAVEVDCGEQEDEQAVVEATPTPKGRSAKASRVDESVNDIPVEAADASVMTEPAEQVNAPTASAPATPIAVQVQTRAIDLSPAGEGRLNFSGQLRGRRGTERKSATTSTAKPDSPSAHAAQSDRQDSAHSEPLAEKKAEAHVRVQPHESAEAPIVFVKKTRRSLDSTLSFPQHNLFKALGDKSSAEDGFTLSKSRHGRSSSGGDGRDDVDGESNVSRDSECSKRDSPTSATLSFSSRKRRALPSPAAEPTEKKANGSGGGLEGADQFPGAPRRSTRGRT